MNQRKRKTELLSPAGSFDAARAAVNAGADAIYMGGPLFSARAFAESSKTDMLLDTIDFCHLRDVKVFMTLNTLMKEQEFKSLSEYLRPYADRGLDGVIVQDLGVMKLIKEEFPELELHISTQAAVTGARYAKLLKNLGAHRIVLARELSLDEIKHIYEETGAELEVFAHGALCYSCSGMCLMSSFIGGRSGNRGRCAGTCRLPFEVYDDNGRKLNKNSERYVLSMRDLNTVSRLREMIDAGVYSFKIEGRMKSPVYVAAVTSVYRKYLDMAMSQDPDVNADIAIKVAAADMKMLSEGFERGGHTDGYLDHKNGREMVTLTEKPELRVHDEGIINKLKEKYVDNDIRLPISGKAEIMIGQVPKLTLNCRYKSIDKEVTVCGDTIVSAAEKRPVTREDIMEKLSKFGGTDCELKKLELDMRAEEENGSGLFVPVKALNELRRTAAEELKNSILAAGKDFVG